MYNVFFLLSLTSSTSCSMRRVLSSDCKKKWIFDENSFAVSFHTAGIFCTITVICNYMPASKVAAIFLPTETVCLLCYPWRDHLFKYHELSNKCTSFPHGIYFLRMHNILTLYCSCYLSSDSLFIKYLRLKRE